MADIINLSLLKKLKETTKPSWGVMTSQHMVEHLIAAVKMSNGKITCTNCMNTPERYAILKRYLLSSKPLPKNFVNTVIGKKIRPLKYKNLELAKEKLKIELDDFRSYFESNPENRLLNLTFGPLNYNEWKVFHKKHFIHHFTQFGLVKSFK